VIIRDDFPLIAAFIIVCTAATAERAASAELDSAATTARSLAPVAVFTPITYSQWIDGAAMLAMGVLPLATA